MINVQGVSKRFGTLLAVDNISFEVGQSEILGLLGPNGAGKTTTIRMLSTLIAPTSGKIIIDQKDAHKNNYHIRSITGLLTETPGMYENISAQANLAYFSSFYDIEPEKRERNIEKFLRMFGLWERRDEQVATYSKGMKQKLALARALVHEPKILFLDEPTSGLDPESSRMVRDFLISLKEEKTTVILCTHNLTEASTLSDKVCILKKKIIKIAEMDKLKDYKEIKQAEVVLLENSHRYLALINRIEGVIESKAQGNRIKLSIENPHITNPNILLRLIEAGARIIYFNEVSESLEDIYLDLVRDEKDE